MVYKIPKSVLSRELHKYNDRVTHEAIQTYHDIINDFMETLAESASTVRVNSERKTLKGNDIITALHILGYE
ncbi:MAG: NFYB/HAP3 family transcription factor subunit [Methanosphaera sp.]|uniref:histone-like protein n=1 Tax=Methanosphaera sp. TaxID=2666342 RepID=UPI00261F6CF4|nr:histone-like protein [Methanosphaera sp.]MDD6534966.1 NFYB/HAP3 family transcription factor subunit [Methanosphaera sp.]